MAAIEEAKRLVRAGCFSEALAALDAGRVGSADKTAADVLRTELLERVGHYDLAHRQATELLKSRRLNATERSACCFVLAHLESLAGKADAAIEWLQRAVSFAERDGNHERACWAKLRLLVLVADHSGFEAAVSLVSDLRASAIRSADPAIVAAVHLYVAQTEAKRGLLSTPRKHVRLALDLLKSAPNVWLASMASHIESAVAIMRVDFGHAATHAKRAVELAEQSGVTHSIVSCVGTLAHIQVVTGDLDSAVLLQKSSLSKSLIGSDNYIGSLETLARIRLLQNRLEECDQVLEQIDQLSDPSRSSLRYVHRYMMLTRADLASRRQRLDEALVHIETAIRLGQGAEDQLLIHIATLKKAELLATDSRCDEALATLAQIAPTVSSQPLDVHALSERVLGSILCTEGQPNAGASHLARARRVYETLHHASGLIELDWLRQAATAKTSGVSSSRGTHPTDSLAGSPAVTLESIAALFLYADRPDLVARELTEWARSAGLFESVRTVLRKSDRSDECVASDGTRFPSEERHLAVGATPDGDISVAFVLKSGVEPVAVFEAIRALLESVRQLQTARHEREQRATLWPVEELPIEGDSSVISGHMRELMTYARRIAKTKVNVLITGESGTGKEILARAIHNFSDRADKPFVPFNCTAIPRDLLESQLFGHRRGAFTGADRDHAGIIRAAREGTLFLDEIGELSLDLQPKLLRFLESGEIAPLGETGPLTIDVRIVAATNMNLEDAVHAGRFREDLFYRLNVVRLSLRPLRERRDEIPTFVSHFVAHAADEFKKGHLTVPEETMERLLLYRWPGNVRQLHNELRRIVALAEPNSTITPEAINEDILGALPIFRRPGVNGSELSVSLRAKLLPTLSRIECEMIKAALKEHGGKVNAVAKALGISRKGLYLKRQRLGL